MTWAPDGSSSMWTLKMMFFLLATILGSKSRYLVTSVIIH